MSSKYEFRPISKKKLDDFVFNEHKEANFLQCSAWGKTYEIDDKKVFYYGLFDGKKMLASVLAILKPAKRGRYLEVPGGPILDWSDKELVSEVMLRLKQLARENNCVFVRMRPNIPDTEEYRALMKQSKLKMSPMHLHAEHTVMMNLAQSEEDLIKNMRRQTRYEVRRAEKLGITVTSSSRKEDFEAFYNLQLETAKRQGFIPSERKLIIAQHEAFGKNAKIYTARLDDKILAQGLIVMQKPEAIYNEAASSLYGRKYPGAYALQWQVMKDAKRLGIERYNLFGIAPPNSPRHRYAGVTTFKTGFGGELVTYLPAHDLVIKPIHYKFVQILEKTRKKLRHL